MRRRWWVLAAGMVLLLLGIGPSGVGTATRTLRGPLGDARLFWAVLGVLLSIAAALGARRHPRRPTDSD